MYHFYQPRALLLIPTSILTAQNYGNKEQSRTACWFKAHGVADWEERPKCWVSFARTEGFSAAHPKSQNIREHSGSAGLQPGSSKQNKPLNETQQSVCVNFWTALLFWSRRVQYQEELNVWLFRKSMHRQSFGPSRSFLLFFLFFPPNNNNNRKTMIFC